MTDTLGLDEKAKAVEGKFNSLAEDIKNRREKIADLNREVAGLMEEQVRLQGEFRAIKAIRESLDGGDNGKTPPATVN
ncbi:hypothetical protein CCP2SC5_1900006 [Azospirillaceae bacterium]